MISRRIPEWVRAFARWEHAVEMARRKGERAARVPLSYDPSRVLPLLRGFYARREKERDEDRWRERAALRAVRARRTNFLGETQR